MKQFFFNVAMFFKSLKLLLVCEMVYTTAWVVMFRPEDFEELYYLMSRMDILYPYLFDYLKEMCPEYSMPKWVESSEKYIDRRTVSIKLLAKKREIYSAERSQYAVNRALTKSWDDISRIKNRMDDYINQQ